MGKHAKPRRSHAIRPIESLEGRQMLDVAATAVLARAALAHRLVRDPVGADREGLGWLARELAAHPKFAQTHGRGALLGHVLAGRPGYARSRGLAGMIRLPRPTPIDVGGPSIAGGKGGIHDPNYTVPCWAQGGCLDVADLFSGCIGCQETATSAAPEGNGIIAGDDRYGVTNSDIGLVTGEFFQDHAVVPYASVGMIRGVDLEYSSLQADARPVVQWGLTANGDSGWSSVTSIAASFTLDGTGQGSAATFSTSSMSPGATFIIGLQGDATGLATGVYLVDLTLGVVKSGTTYTTHATDEIAVINAAASPYGAGWSLGGLQAIAGGSGTTSVLVTDGSRWGTKYTYDGTDYHGPAGETSALVHNGGGTWTRTYTDGTVVQFDSSGRETSITDRNGNATAYAYYTSGAAAGAVHTITDPAGLITTLAYDGSGKLQTIADPAGRVTTITVDGNGNLTDIVDPDSAHEQYGYSTPSNHRITTEASPNGATATVSYDSFARATTEALFGATGTTTVLYAQKMGLAAAGGSGTLVLAADPSGSVTDPLGHSTTLTFDHHYMKIAEADATGATTLYGRNADERATDVTDPLGRITSYSYDSDGNVTSVTRPDGTSMAIAYGTNDQVTQVTDYRGLITTYTLDSDGNATRRTDPDGNHEDWTYNAAGQVLTDTDRNGHTVSFAYDSYGRLTTITLPDAGSGTATVTVAYDSAGNVTSATDALGHATHYTYDLAGRVKSVADPVQYGAGHATSYTYDADGNLTAITGALGHVTSLAYDARDRLTTLTDAANQGTGHATVYGYDGMNLTSVTDPNGHTTTYAYDGVNRPVGSTDPLGHRATLVYDLAGQRTQATDANGHTVTYAYDLVGRVGTVTYPGTADNGSGTMIAVTARYTYNNNDQVTAVTDSLGHTTTYSHDNLGRTTAVTDALGHSTSVGYDLAGNRTTVTDALGHTTTSTFDARDELRTVTEPSGGGTTTYSYDQGGRLTSLTDPVGNTTGWSYDSADQVLVETDPRSKLTTYTYDLAGNLATKTDRDLRVTSFAYNADDRLKTEDWMAGGSSIRRTTYSYDYGGRLTSVQDPDSHYAYTYDNADRLLTVDDNGTPILPQVTLTYGYDNAGNRTSLDDSKGGLTSYTYDVRDELVTITQSGSGVASKRADFAYDAAGRMTTLTRYADTSGTTTVLVSKYAYDAANRLTTLTHQTAGATVRSQYVYALDAANRLTGESRTWTTGGGTATDTLAYSYTSNNQLTGVTHSNGSFGTETYTYDNNGNRNASGYSTTTGNRMTTDGTYNYAYDDEGNLTSKTTISSGDQTLYSYDYRNRLVEVDSHPYGGSTTVLATYTYDALGRRIGVREGGSTTATLYDGVAAILDFDGSGTQKARYLQGPAVDMILARETGSGTVAWYLADRLGTVRDIADNSGAIVDHIDYDSYGNVVAESAPSFGDRWKFTGREYDAATGLYYYRARWYDPNSGRFINQDPIGFAGGDANTSRYVGNDPAGGIDPSGLRRPKHIDNRSTNGPIGGGPQMQKRLGGEGEEVCEEQDKEKVPEKVKHPLGYLPEGLPTPPSGNQIRDIPAIQQLTQTLYDGSFLVNEGDQLPFELGVGIYLNVKTGQMCFEKVSTSKLPTPTPSGPVWRTDFQALPLKGNPKDRSWQLIATIHTHRGPVLEQNPSEGDLINSKKPVNPKFKYPVPWLVVTDTEVIVIGPDKVKLDGNVIKLIPTKEN